jgi:hypothetical protein
MYRDKKILARRKFEETPVRQSRIDKQRKYSAAVRKATDNLNKAHSFSANIVATRGVCQEAAAAHLVSPHSSMRSCSTSQYLRAESRRLSGCARFRASSGLTAFRAGYFASIRNLRFDFTSRRVPGSPSCCCRLVELILATNCMFSRLTGV